jgi:hypothetical protein
LGLGSDVAVIRQGRYRGSDVVGGGEPAAGQLDVQRADAELLDVVFGQVV